MLQAPSITRRGMRSFQRRSEDVDVSRETNGVIFVARGFLVAAVMQAEWEGVRAKGE